MVERLVIETWDPHSSSENSLRLLCQSKDFSNFSKLSSLIQNFAKESPGFATSSLFSRLKEMRLVPQLDNRNSSPI